MVRLVINDIEYYGFTVNNLSLIYNSIASSFGFSSLNDYTPEPLIYPEVKIYKDDLLILTGTILNQSYQDSSSPNLVSVSGYSKAGVLEDCTIPLSLMPMQLDNMSLEEICIKLLKPFGINFTFENSVYNNINEKFQLKTNSLGTKSKKTVLNSRVSNLMKKKFIKVNFEYDKTIKTTIIDLAATRGIYVNHTPNGDIRFTDSSTDNLEVIETFIDDGVTLFSLDINGQEMNSEISILTQAEEKDIFEGEYTIKNPYVENFRPIIYTMKHGDSLDVKEFARIKLSEQLRAIKLKISTTKFVLPGQLISVKSNELKLRHEVQFFVEQTDIKQNSKGETYELTCVLKDVYSKNDVKNEFR